MSTLTTHSLYSRFIPHVGRLVMSLSVCAFVALVSSAWGQADDFNDGDDEGWTRYDPLGGLGLGSQATFSFPNGNSYRIQTPVLNPAFDVAAVGPGRAGGVFGAPYGDFYITVDVIDWDDTTRQAFGILARITTPGLGTLNGYAFTYERGSGVTPTSGDTDISLINGEDPSSIEVDPSGYHLDPTKDYRFVFIGKGAQLEGRIYELDDLENAVVTITATDGTHTSGAGGLVTFDNTAGMGVTDATFDNFRILAAEPPKLSLLLNELQEVELRWSNEGGPYQLQWTADLTPPVVWTEVPANQIFDEPPTGKSHFAGVEAGTKIYRLVQD